ncbi:response regulator transcription factor [Desulfurispira natronophila]|uniref:DNA-binding response OmpR family regulator n=1 Tax=Desulfurispira natronophila TaxID=682562 RepID=A0A7W7Y2A2_9BACT|nr:response regulator [Desulfurispira natronophila]MBB5020785.1 DNA-binding response OmpR family regulator [Desulfurispira natronophila]
MTEKYSVPLKDMTILVADDDSEALGTLERSLKRDFGCVLTARDGEEAIRLFEENQVHISLLDIVMPKMSGLDVASKIRERDPDIPIVVLTAHDDNEKIRSAVRLRLMDYLVKPVEINQLKEVLKNCVDELEKRGRLWVRLCNGASFNAITNEVKIDGQTHILTKSEKLFLESLLRRRGQVVSTEEIARYINEDGMTPGGLRTLVYRLRGKVGSDAVVSAKDVGYMAP